jgi:hypothetical protein
LGAGGCGKDHSQDVVGVWDWGTFAVHFDSDHSWGATDKQHAAYEKMGGSWSLEGDRLKMTYAGSAAPSPDGSVFIVSDDGTSMEADIAAVGTMKKRFLPASMNVK